MILAGRVGGPFCKYDNLPAGPSDLDVPSRQDHTVRTMCYAIVYLHINADEGPSGTRPGGKYEAVMERYRGQRAERREKTGVRGRIPQEVR